MTIESVSNTALTAAPDASAPAEEFSMPLLTEEDIIRRCRKVRGSFWLLLVALMVGVCWVPTGHAHGITAYLLRAMMFAVGTIALGAIYDTTPALRPQQYDWLSSASCASLADLCEEYPDLVPYRDRVRAEGRKFTRGEYIRMKLWVLQQQTKASEAGRAARELAACQRLYGVPAE